MTVLANISRRLPLAIDITGWAAVALMTGILSTQAAGWSGTRSSTVLQAGTPCFLAASLPLGALAIARRRWRLAGASGVVAVAFVMLAWPVLFPPGQATASAGTPLKVLHANLLFGNPTPTAMAAAIGDANADVIAFTEFTPELAAVLDATSWSKQFRYRVERPSDRASGTAIWSRTPLREQPEPDTQAETVVVTVSRAESNDPPITVVAAHATSPLVGLDSWHRDLELLGTLPDDGAPTLMIGDFNAGFWHPPFRELLDAGWTDAHDALRKGFTNSWPTDIAFVPPLTRLDHALVDDDLVVTDVSDIDIPGSDHRAILVTVVPAA